MPDTLTLGLVQMSMSADRQDNLRRAAGHVRTAAEQGASVVCLPELFLSRYFCQTEDADTFALAEPVPGPTTEALEPLAAELDIVIVASLFEKRARGLYHNTAAVIDAGLRSKVCIDTTVPPACSTARNRALPARSP